MPSQKSIPPPGAAVAPKRQRGRDRVEAILSAATDLFAEKGYEAVTMTEIAAHADTAIGSLYRFFPTREAVAWALLDRYGAHMVGALDAIVSEGEDKSSTEIAAALIGLVRALRAERSAVLPLVDIQKDGGEHGTGLRDAILDRLNAILVQRGLLMSPPDNPQAVTLLHLLKMAWSLTPFPAEKRESMEYEAERLITLYLASISNSLPNT